MVLSGFDRGRRGLGCDRDGLGQAGRPDCASPRQVHRSPIGSVFTPPVLGPCARECPCKAENHGCCSISVRKRRVNRHAQRVHANATHGLGAPARSTRDKRRDRPLLTRQRLGADKQGVLGVGPGWGSGAKRPEEIGLLARWRLVRKHFRTSSEPLRDFRQSWAQAGVTTDAAGSAARSPCFPRQKRVQTQLNGCFASPRLCTASELSTVRLGDELQVTRPPASLDVASAVGRRRPG